MKLIKVFNDIPKHLEDSNINFLSKNFQVDSDVTKDLIRSYRMDEVYRINNYLNNELTKFGFHKEYTVRQDTHNSISILHDDICIVVFRMLFTTEDHPLELD